MTTSWRIVMDLLAFVVADSEINVVYLSAIEKSAYKFAVTKLIRDSYEEIHISDNKFKLKITADDYDNNIIHVWAKSDQLPKKDEWYFVGNSELCLGNIISDLTVTRGILEGYEFEATFSDSLPDKVSFTCPELKNYKESYNEMVRRLNCELLKKTKKWVPGHRYDTQTETLFYLCSVKSRRVKLDSSEWTENPEECPEVYLVVRDIKDSEKTISDVLKNRVFGNGPDDIQTLTSIKSMVDSGEALKNDYSDDISTYWSSMLKTAKERTLVTKEFGYTYYSNPKTILDIFGYFSPENPYPKEINSVCAPLIQELKEIIRKIGYNTLVNTRSFESGTTVEERANILIKYTYMNILDMNILKCKYFDYEIRNYFGIDIEEEYRTLINNWSEADICSNFESYLMNQTYIKGKYGALQINQRSESSSFSKLANNYLKDELGEGELTDSLKELIHFANKNHGIGATSYKIVPVIGGSSRKEKKEYVVIDIGLKDLILYVTKEGKEVSENLKREIMSRRFSHLKIYCDKNAEIS